MPGAHDLVNARVTHASAHVSAARGGACIVEEHMCAHVQACTCISSATIHAPQRVPGTVPADCTRVCKYKHNGNDTNFGLAKALACFRGPVCNGPCTFKPRLLSQGSPQHMCNNMSVSGKDSMTPSPLGLVTRTSPQPLVTRTQ